MPDFKKWPSIEKFSDVYATAQRFGVKSVIYTPKIKLHGTNAGIHIHEGKFYPQKRTSFITVDDDNAGFAKFVATLPSLQGKWSGDLIIYGEWAGSGIQKTDAVSKLSQKIFFVFSVYDPLFEKWYTLPEDLQYTIHSVFGDHPQIKVIPDYGYDNIYVDFTDQKSCQNFIDKLMSEVDEIIGKEDPYIKETFGISGPGEGLVCYPKNVKLIDGSIITDTNIAMGYMFKVKTESHSVQKEKKRNHVAPEKPEGIDDFIATFFTEQRYEQILNELGGKASPEKTGEFLKGVMTDVHKESQNEIALANFDWNEVPKHAVARVKQWWFQQCSKL